MAGEGTAGLEIMSQVPNADAVVIPVGGGGMLAGIALAIKTQNANITIIVIFFPIYKPDPTRLILGGRIGQMSQFFDVFTKR